MLVTSAEALVLDVLALWQVWHHSPVDDSLCHVYLGSYCYYFCVYTAHGVHAFLQLVLIVMNESCLPTHESCQPEWGGWLAHMPCFSPKLIHWMSVGLQREPANPL